MRCYRVRRFIEDYHYGELEDRQAAKVAAHLRACEGCRRVLALLEREARIYEAYEAKTESALDIVSEKWRGAIGTTEGQIAAAKVRDARRCEARRLSGILPASPWVRQALAAALLVAVSVSATLFIVERQRAKETAGMQQESVAVAGSEKSLEAALESIQRAEQEYLNAIQQLNAIVERQKPTLDPRSVAELQINLRMIDEYIAATRKAYYAHPTDADLALLMLAAYSRKVELLQDLTS